MEGDSNLLNVLGFLEVVRDAATVVLVRAAENVSLARPARVGPDIVVPGVVRYATVRAAATPRRPRVVSICLDIHPGTLARIDKGWYEHVVRRSEWRCVCNVVILGLIFSMYCFCVHSYNAQGRA